MGFFGRDDRGLDDAPVVARLGQHHRFGAQQGVRWSSCWNAFVSLATQAVFRPRVRRAASADCACRQNAASDWVMIEVLVRLTLRHRFEDDHGGGEPVPCLVVRLAERLAKGVDHGDGGLAAVARPVWRGGGRLFVRMRRGASFGP